MRNRLSLIAALILSISALAAADANFLDAYAPPLAAPNSSINVTAALLNSSNTSQYLANFNITASLNTSNHTNTTTAGGPMLLNLTVPASLYGEYNVTVADNSTDSQSKNIPIYITNVSNASFSFTNKFPPFSAGSSFSINITLTHVNGSLLAAYNLGLLSVEVFSANSNETTGWGVANLTAATDATGTAQYNVTVPSAADGQYALAVDKGAGFLMFMVKSGYTMAVSPQDSTGEIKMQFAPTDAVSVLAKIRDSDGDPVTSGVSAIAYITLPNGTIVSKSLPAANQTAFPGFYNGSYTPSASVTGTYGVRVSAVAGTQSLEGFTQFFTQSFSARLADKAEFFEDWGGMRAIQPGGTVKFDVIATNLTDGSTIAGGTNASNQTGVNCSQLGNVSVYWAANNTLFDTITNAQYSQGTYEGASICSVEFASPGQSSQYRAELNISINGTVVAAGGFFITQNFFLKARPVNSFGGGEFFQVFYPGSNVTFDVLARNLSSQADLNGSNISAITVRRVRALAFETGGSDQQGVVYSAEYGNTPRVTVALPANTTGPMFIEIEATVAGGAVSGNAMVFAKYIAGFVAPKLAFGGEQKGPPAAKCTGVQLFSGMVKDIRTNQNAQGVTINGVREMRDEFTGRDLTSCVSVASAASNSNSGSDNIEFNATFNASCGLSGEYFMMVNVSYQGQTDFLPAGFSCKQMFASIDVIVGNQQGWMISPQDAITIEVSEIKLINGSNVTSATFVVAELMNFNPSTGGRRFSVAGGMQLTNTTISGGFGALNLTPANFSAGGVNLSKWPSGFVELRLRICGSGACDTGFAGMQVVDFNAFTWMMGPPPQLYPGQSVSVTVLAATNVSAVGNFSVKIGRPEEGMIFDAAVDYANTVKEQDGWNAPGDNGFENWTVAFTAPADAPKGWQPAIITVNSSYHNSTVDLFYPLQITKYQVYMPFEEGVQIYQDGVMMRAADEISATNKFNVTADGVFDANGNLIAMSKSAGGPPGGRYCLKYGLNSTRWGNGGETDINYNMSWHILMVDNTTPGAYDTIIVNESSVGMMWWTNINNRSIANNIGLQLWNIWDCAFFTMVNTTVPIDQQASGNNWGGSHEVNKSFLVPFLAKQAGSPIVGANIGVAAIIKQNEVGRGSSGGNGFESQLAEGTDYVVHSEITTDANGFGFINLTILRSGSFMMFWNLTKDGATDTAGFDSGTFMEVKTFDCYGNAIDSVPRPITLQNATYDVNWTAANYSGPDLNLAIFNLTDIIGGPDQATWFIGTFAEATASELVNDSNLSAWNFAWRPGDNRFIMDDDSNFTVFGGIPNFNDGPGDNATPMLSELNNSICVSADCNPNSPQLKLGRIENYWTPESPLSYTKMVLFQETQGGGGQPITVASANANLSVKVCAQTFGKPGTALAGANVTIFMQQWGMNGATQTNLSLYDPLNDTQLDAGTPLPAAASGCLTAKVKAPNSGWPIQGMGGSSAEIKSRITNNTNSETGWVAMVQYFG